MPGASYICYGISTCGKEIAFQKNLSHRPAFLNQKVFFLCSPRKRSGAEKIASFPLLLERTLCIISITILSDIFN